MPEPRRGENTKARILEEACKVFAEKGYRDATHAEICRRAHSNVASINYYFGSKEALYKEVFECLVERADTLYPFDGGLPASSSPEQRLGAYIRGFLGRMFDPERLGALHKIRMSEMFDSTGLLTEQLQQRLAQDREHLQRILRELLGPSVPRRDVEWCELSVIGQCLMTGPGPDNKGPRALFGLSAAQVDRLAEHILAFSVAGTKAIGRKQPAKTGADK